MNEARVRSVPVSNGFEGHFKKLHRSGWFPVEENGIATLFPSAELATIAAYEAMNRHLFGDGILRDGEKAGSAHADANAMFSKIFPGKGRKPVEVVRK